ncbi:hypothetical protein V8C35DRAFT_263946 [Trichoderma chlorosporum]
MQLCRWGGREEMGSEEEGDEAAKGEAGRPFSMTARFSACTHYKYRYRCTGILAARTYRYCTHYNQGSINPPLRIFPFPSSLFLFAITSATPPDSTSRIAACNSVDPAPATDSHTRLKHHQQRPKVRDTGATCGFTTGCDVVHQPRHRCGGTRGLQGAEEACRGLAGSAGGIGRHLRPLSTPAVICMCSMSWFVVSHSDDGSTRRSPGNRSSRYLAGALGSCGQRLSGLADSLGRRLTQRSIPYVNMSICLWT